MAHFIGQGGDPIHQGDRCWKLPYLRGQRDPDALIPLDEVLITGTRFEQGVFTLRYRHVNGAHGQEKYHARTPRLDSFILIGDAHE